MRWLLTFLAVSAYGQLVVTPTTCTFQMQQSGPTSHSCAITITGTGAWTGVVGTDPFAWTTASGSGAATVFLKPSIGFDQTAVSTLTYNQVTIAGQAIAVSMTVSPSTPVPTYSNALHVADASLACTNPDATAWWFRATCPDSGARPGGTSLPPALGSTYTDSILGTTVRLSVPCYHQYTGLNQISADNALIITDSPSLACAGIYNRLTGVKVYEHPRTVNSNDVTCHFSPVDALVGYCTSVAYLTPSYYKFTLDGAGGIIDNGAVFTNPHGSAPGNGIGHGGEAEPTYDGWLPAIACNQSWLYAVNLYTGASVPFDMSTLPVADQLKAGTTAGSSCGPGNNPDALYITGPDADGWYYLWMVIDYTQETVRAHRLFKYKSGDPTLTYVGLGPPAYEYAGNPTPTWENACTAENAVTGQCFPEQGNHYATAGAIFIGPLERTGLAYQSFLTLLTPSKGLPNMSKPMALGGGLAWINSGLTAHQAGARNAPYVVSSGVATITVYAITAASGSSPVTLTIPGSGWMTGTSVLLSCNGSEVMSGLSRQTGTVTALGGNQYTIALATSGSYVANKCWATLNVTPDQTGKEIQVHRISSTFGVLQSVRLAQTRSVLSDADTYVAFPMPDISTDGSLVMWKSNWGFAGEVSQIYTAANPMTATADNELSISGRTVIPSGAGTFTVLAPTADNVSISVYPNLSLGADSSSTSSTCTASGGAVYPTPRTAICSGLSLGTTYYWRATALNGTYVAAGTITPAVSTLRSGSLRGGGLR